MPEICKLLREATRNIYRFLCKCNPSAEALSEHVVKITSEFDIESTFVGQMHAEAAVMAYRITGIQK